MSGSGDIARKLLIARIDGERTIDLDRYGEDGCDGRFDWLESLAETHSLSLAIVVEMADLLGPDEDFDGLVTACEDAEMGFGMGGSIA